MKVLPATERNIAVAAKSIRDGRMVVMPTETVYGLAVDATNPAAVDKVYQAKERPADNPLIVHIAGIEEVLTVAAEFPEAARALASRFWPGPVTLVLPSAGTVAPQVTGGLDTVAIRMPSHNVAISLIRASGLPLAAPSANRFMKLSPTRVEHLDPVILSKAAAVLDGGPCEVGVESTVVDCTTETIRILRPGGVSRAEIEAALGSPLGEIPPQASVASPGMYPRHYSPKTPVRLVDRLDPSMAGLTFGEPSSLVQMKMPRSAGAYASVLYDCLHHLDALDQAVIFVERPPDDPEWEAIRDRLTKASRQ